jgi:ferredoxin
MNRYHELEKILDAGRYFKVVCGAGNEDPAEVQVLSMVYTLAGALGIDLSANPEVVEASMRGVDRALELASDLGVRVETRPFLNVSVGLKGDPPVRQAAINPEACQDCGACEGECDQEAISGHPPVIATPRCIGCGKCAEVCPAEAIGFSTRKVDFHDILPRCLAAGAETIELHAIIADDAAVMNDWQTVADILPDQFISMCIDRSQLSDRHFADRVRQAASVAGERLIIQADGAPMSGGPDGCRTTLQAVACADLTMKTGVPCKILLSGGTNSHTGELAGLCGLKVHGVSIGTFARNLIREEIREPGLDRDLPRLRAALAKATALVDGNLKHIAR